MSPKTAGPVALSAFLVAAGCNLQPVDAVPEADVLGGMAEAWVTESGFQVIAELVPDLVENLAAFQCGNRSCPTGLVDGSGNRFDTSCLVNRCIDSSGRVPPLVGVTVSPVSVSGFDICTVAGEECTAWVVLSETLLLPEAPDTLQATVQAQIKTTNFPVRTEVSGAEIGCQVRLDTTLSANPEQALSIDVQLPGYQAPGGGPSRAIRLLVDGLDTAFDQNDIVVEAPPGASAADRLDCAGLDALKSLIGPLIVEELESVMQEEVDEFLALPCTGGCPASASCQNEVCVDSAGIPIPQFQGVEGYLELSDLFPDLSGRIGYSFEAGPGVSAESTGASVSARGGLVATTNGDACAPARPAPWTTPAFQPALSLERNDQADLDFDGTPETRYSFAVGASDVAFDALAWSIEQSGLLCTSFDTDMVPVLTTAALELIAPSIYLLVDPFGEGRGAPVRAVLRTNGPLGLAGRGISESG